MGTSEIQQEPTAVVWQGTGLALNARRVKRLVAPFHLSRERQAPETARETIARSERKAVGRCTQRELPPAVAGTTVVIEASQACVQARSQHGIRSVV
jgi:hypothetical protein